jgi:hypothetical protein
MLATTTCCDDPCGCEESAFARLRYSYGQRLTAVDLLDEQSYLIGKDRFVARHVLGAGILCGLRAERGDGPPERTPTIRVSRGAALDLCGRAVVVEHDQCLDVAAWYARRREDLSWEGPGTYPAWIGLRYRECPSDPVRVPGDPCGCDGEGCAYTRVHESFELALHADGGAVEPAQAPAGWSQLCHDLGEHPAAPPLGPALCPPCACEDWLLVAAVDVVLDEPGAGAGLRATDITDPVEADPRRLNLHSLAALQRVVVDLGAGGDGCADGPQLSGLSGDGDLAGDGTLAEGRAVLAVALATDEDGAPVPLASATVDTDRLKLFEIGASGWTQVNADVEYDDAAPAFHLSTKAATLDQPYRLTFRDDPAEPIADEQLRPLRPDDWSRVVRWVVQPAAPGSGDPDEVILQTTT